MQLIAPIFEKHIVSSKYCFQKLIYARKVGTMVFSNLVMKVLTRTGLSGNAIARQSIC